MGLVKLPFACQDPWKIYGNQLQGLALADQYRCCHQRMVAILAKGNRKLLELGNPTITFFVSIVKIIINIDGLLVGGAVMRRLNDGKGSKDGKEGNMYQYLGSDEQERQSNRRCSRTGLATGT